MRLKMCHHDHLRGGSRVLCQYFAFVRLITVLLALVFPFCASSISDYYDISTEPPDIVEWITSTARPPPQHRQIQIKSLKLETHVKLRYARTRIKIHLNNPHDRELQAAFKIILPENAFFTILQLKIGAVPKTYAAEVVKRSVGLDIFHFASEHTNGTVSAAYIELSALTVAGLPCYNLKFTLSAGESFQSFLVYERQLNRDLDVYSDRIQVFPTIPLANSTVIGAVEFIVNVEEMEGVRSLHCTNETLEHFSNCSSTIRNTRRRNGQQYKLVELTWKGRDVAAQRLGQHPFHFTYELEQQNDTTSAVLISQHNGNFYFVHLFVPKNLPPIRKHIIFLLDISDSMHGKKLEQLQWSMKEILDDLETDDFFNIVAFSNDITTWTKFRGDRRKCPFPFPASEENKDSAVDFIENKLIAHGTTNIYLGLSTVFDMVRLFSLETEDTCVNATDINTPKTKRMKDKVAEKLPLGVESMIFFLSDGKATSGPTDSISLLKYFHELNQVDGSDEKLISVQIHTIAYGEDADVDFLRALSSLNGGSTRVIREESAAGIELTNFYQEISSQVLSHVRTSLVINDTLLLPSSRISTSPVTVIRGSEVLTAGQLFPQNDSSQMIPADALNWSTEGVGKSGKLAYYNSPVYDCRNLQMTMAKCVQRIDYYLERLQAYQLLKKLLERDRLVEQGYICPRHYHDTFQDLKMERMGQDDADYSDESLSCYNIFKQQATELALKHRFVTPYTSFILTTEQVDNGLRGSDVIAGAGSSEEDFAENLNKAVPTLRRKTEKLIILGSVSPPEAVRQKPKLAPQFHIQPDVGEELPIASKRVNIEDINDNNDTFTGMANSTTNNDAASGGLRLFAKSMRDFVVKSFQKLFRLPTSEETKQQTFNLTDLVGQSLHQV